MDKDPQYYYLTKLLIINAIDIMHYRLKMLNCSKIFFRKMYVKAENQSNCQSVTMQYRLLLFFINRNWIIQYIKVDATDTLKIGS